MSAKNEHGLTPQMERFAQQVALGSVSASKAYRECYPRAKSWKDSAVHVAASELLANPKVRGRVDALQAEAAQKAGLKAERVLEEVARLAHSDIAGIMTEDGKVKLPHELDADTAAAVSGFKIDEYGRVEYKMHDKNSPNERLFKHLNLYKDNNQDARPLMQVAVIRLVALEPIPGVVIDAED
jgi:phage terminase small subunit